VTDYTGIGDVAIFRARDGYASPSIILTRAAPGDTFGAKIAR